MIVAVVAVNVMQMPVHQVVDVVTMRNRFVTASWAVDVPRFVSVAAMPGRTGIWIHIGYGDEVLIDVTVVRVVEVPVVQVADVALMNDGHVTAVRTVNMLVAIVDCAIGHRLAPLRLT